MNSMDFLYTAVILTAGESRRMGFPKALLDAGNGKKFIENIFCILEKITPQPFETIAVLGYHKDRIVNEAQISESCKIVTNPEPERGQLSSLVEALRSYDSFRLGKIKGLLVCLVDHPFVAESTFQKIVNHASLNPGSIIIPRFDGRKGHPVFFPAEIFMDLMEAPLDQGARYAVNKNSDRIIVVDVDDSAILKDVDTPAEYHAHLGKSPY